MVTDKTNPGVLSLVGLSTDTKPTKVTLPLMRNGSIFKAIDTGEVYIFNETANAWAGPYENTNCINVLEKC